MNSDIFYFSATGNTENSVKLIAKDIEEAGQIVNIVRLSGKTSPPEKIADRVILAFPTLAWRPPALIMRFIRRLPKVKPGEKKFAYVLAVAGGGAKGAPKVAAKKLAKKGYKIALCESVNYADNWVQMMSAPDKEQKKKKNAIGANETKNVIPKILNSEEIKKISLSFPEKLINIIGLLFALIGRRFLGKLFIADSDCNKCGLCKRACPVGAIVIKEGKKSRPWWRFNCESCNRCINICPVNAVNSSIPRALILILFTTLFIIAGIIGYDKLAGLYVESLPGWLFTATYIAAVIALLFITHILSFGVLDMILLRPLQGLGAVRKFLEKSYTKKFRRYTFDGYKPPNELTKSKV